MNAGGHIWESKYNRNLQTERIEDLRPTQWFTPINGLPQSRLIIRAAITTLCSGKVINKTVPTKVKEFDEISKAIENGDRLDHFGENSKPTENGDKLDHLEIIKSKRYPTFAPFP